jgi:hypothetical protein
VFTGISGSGVDPFVVVVVVVVASSSGGGYGRCFPHDMGLVQSTHDNSSGSFAKSSSLATYAGFVAGGPDGADDIAGPAEAGSPFNVMIGGIEDAMEGYDVVRARERRGLGRAAGGAARAEREGELSSRRVGCMWESVSGPHNQMAGADRLRFASGA